jgi:hypothetical protein
MATRTVEISDDVFEVAKRAAAIDKVDVTTLLESLIRSRAEYLDALGDLSPGHYEMQRDPGETDENTRIARASSGERYSTAIRRLRLDAIPLRIRA